MELDFASAADDILKALKKVDVPTSIEEVVLMKSVLTCIDECDQLPLINQELQLCAVLSEALTPLLSKIDYSSLSRGPHILVDAVKKRDQKFFDTNINTDAHLADRLVTLMADHSANINAFEAYIVKEALYFSEYQSLSKQMINTDLLLYLFGKIERHRPDIDKNFTHSLYKDIQIWLFTKEPDTYGKMRLASALMKRKLFSPTVEEADKESKSYRLKLPTFTKRKKSSLEQLFDLFCMIEYMVCLKYIKPGLVKPEGISFVKFNDKD